MQERRVRASGNRECLHAAGVVPDDEDFVRVRRVNGREEPFEARENRLAVRLVQSHDDDPRVLWMA